MPEITYRTSVNVIPILEQELRKAVEKAQPHLPAVLEVNTHPPIFDTQVTPRTRVFVPRKFLQLPLPGHEVMAVAILEPNLIVHVYEEYLRNKKVWPFFEQALKNFAERFKLHIQVTWVQDA